MPGLPGLPADPLGDVDLLSTADDTFRAILASLRAYGVHVLPGPEVSRPAPSTATIGRVFVATDTDPRQISLDVGPAWIGPFVVGNDARLSDQRTPLDASVTAAKISAALKPSGGTAAGTEALRAIGTVAGQAAAGDTHTFSGPVGVAGRFTIDTAGNAQSVVAGAGVGSFNVKVVGEATYRWTMLGDGKMLWGRGAVAGDTNLYSPAAGVLRTDQSFIVGIPLQAVTGRLTVTSVASGADSGHFTDGVTSTLKVRHNRASGATLEWDGDTFFYKNAPGVLKTDGSIIATAFTVSSDARLKKNVETVGGGLAKVRALRGVEFDWRDGKRGKARRIGFLAQEVDKVIPGAAIKEPDGMLTLNQADILPVLVEAIKEQSAIVDKLTARLDELEAVA